MQKILISAIVFISTASTALALGAGDRLDLAITPIRVDISAATSQTTSGSVTLYNNSDQPYSFMMSAEDCVPSTDYRAPLCTSAGTGNLTTSLASWITFDTSGLFTIAAKSNKKVTYFIHTPSSATPGGHYGAIFFNSPDHSNGGTISMNRRIGSLLLVTVPGDIIVAPEFGSILVDSHGGGGGSSTPNIGQDFFKFNQSGSVVDQIGKKGQQLMMIFTDPSIYQPIIDTINPFWSAPDIDPNATFTASLGLPVDNKGTVHIVPEGKITLHDEDGSQLTHIGKELIKNENGAIVGEKIVDYLTINEEGGNVLPGTSRTFTMDWAGFARESIGSDGKVYISYETPGAYYSRIAREESGFLYPWEKLTLHHTIRSLVARVNLSYINPVTHQSVDTNPNIPLTVEYDEIVKTWNTGLATPILLIVLPIWWYIIWRRRRYHYNSHEILVGTDGDDEIAVLERARAVMFAREATRAADTTKKTAPKKVTTKTTEKTATPVKKPARKKSVATEKVTPVKKTGVKKTPPTDSKEEE